MNDFITIAHELYMTNLEYKKLAERKEKLTAQLKAACNNTTTFVAPYLFEQSIRKGSVDYAAIDMLKTIDLELYRKPSVTYWELKKI